MEILHLLLMHLIYRMASAHVYSCDFFKHKKVDLTFEGNPFVCVWPQENFKNFAELNKIHLKNQTTSVSLEEIRKSNNNKCELLNTSKGDTWMIAVSSPDALDCSQKFTLVITKQTMHFNLLKFESTEHVLKAERTEPNFVYVSSATGMRLRNIKCSGTGKVSLYSGAGEGEVEQRYFLQSWACDSLPNYMIIFESVITFKLDRGVEVKFVKSTNLNDKIVVNPDEKIVVIADGRSNNINNQLTTEHIARIQINEWETRRVGVDMHLSFDKRHIRSKLLLRTHFKGQAISHSSGRYNESFVANYFEFRNADELMIDVSIGKDRIDDRDVSPSYLPSISSTSNTDIDPSKSLERLFTQTTEGMKNQIIQGLHRALSDSFALNTKLLTHDKASTFSKVEELKASIEKLLVSCSSQASSEITIYKTSNGVKNSIPDHSSEEAWFFAHNLPVLINCILLICLLLIVAKMANSFARLRKVIVDGILKGHI